MKELDHEMSMVAIASSSSTEICGPLSTPGRTPISDLGRPGVRDSMKWGRRWRYAVFVKGCRCCYAHQLKETKTRARTDNRENKRANLLTSQDADCRDLSEFAGDSLMVY